MWSLSFSLRRYCRRALAPTTRIAISIRPVVARPSLSFRRSAAGWSPSVPRSVRPSVSPIACQSSMPVGRWGVHFVGLDESLPVAVGVPPPAGRRQSILIRRRVDANLDRWSACFACGSSTPFALQLDRGVCRSVRYSVLPGASRARTIGAVLCSIERSRRASPSAVGGPSSPLSRQPVPEPITPASHPVLARVRSLSYP